MERLLGTLVGIGLALALALGLAACGDDSDPASSTPAPSATPGTVVALISESAAGGEVSQAPTRLDSEAAVSEFVGQFNDRPTGRALAEQVRDAVAGASAGSDRTLLGAVVSIGCEAPTGVRVEHRDGPRIVPTGMPKSDVQCLVPVTTVAVVSVE
jgi:hypothetical protein